MVLLSWKQQQLLTASDVLAGGQRFVAVRRGAKRARAIRAENGKVDVLATLLKHGLLVPCTDAAEALVAAEEAAALRRNLVASR